jgi:aminoglycoside 3-N-acetyltransferase
LDLTEQEANHILEDILDGLGICQGDCLMLGIDMSRLPLPAYKAELTREAFREREKKWCRFVLEVILNRIGKNGTLLVPTYSYSCSKIGSIFILESTASEVGPFTEFFRSKQDVIRSLHPIFSVSGIGKAAKSILHSIGGPAFGATSPFARFEEHEVKFLCLGVELRNSITYIHHLEQCFGCTHRYNKIFDTTVYQNSVKIEGEWSAYVAYRGINFESNISSLQTSLDNEGVLIKTEWNGNHNHVAGINDVNRVGYELLKENSFAFVNRHLKMQFDDSFSSNQRNLNVSKLVVTALENKSRN